MKISRILFKSLLAGTLAVSQSLFLSSPNQAKAQSSQPVPYIVLVNGYGNCCAWGIADRFPPMDAEFRAVPYSNFSDGGKSNNTSDDSAFLRDGADFINKLDSNRPLILIGHSFGGDSILKLLPRIKRRIQFVAVIDPVRTGGFRATLKTLSVPSNVDYFYNRWQENLPFPNDFQINGSIPCNARTCDQDSQNIARNADFSPRKTECRWDEVNCPGYSLIPPRKGRKQVRVSHQDLPRDAFLQKDLGDKLLKQVVSLGSPSSAEPSFNNIEDLLVFDAKFYLDNYPDLKAAYGTNYQAATQHWLRQGLPVEGRAGSSVFDAKFYLDKYPDLKAAYGTNYQAATQHWLRQGLSAEGRAGSSVFDAKFYLDKYPDLKAAYGTNYQAATQHWLRQGLSVEGRVGSSE
jgi:pimeloyl-ACP methyl ester carboxylesterase